MTAVTRCPIGVVRDDPALWAMRSRRSTKSIAVARARQIPLPGAHLRRHRRRMAEMPPGTRSSMLRGSRARTPPRAAVAERRGGPDWRRPGRPYADPSADRHAAQAARRRARGYPVGPTVGPARAPSARAYITHMRLHLAAAVLGISLLAPSARAFQNPTSASLVAQASRYVQTFVDRFTNVVSEEHYVQDWKTTAGIALLHRETRADFLLTRVPATNTWHALRDVFEVNGAPVRDREDRMTRLFLQPSRGNGETGRCDRGRERAVQHQQYPANGQPSAVRAHLPAARFPEAILLFGGPDGSQRRARTSG